MSTAVLLDSVISELDCRDCKEQGRVEQRGCYIAGHRRAKPVQYLSPDHPLYQKLYHCPRSASMMVSGWSQDWALFHQGIMPQAGGWDDQQALYCEAMRELQASEKWLEQRRVEEMKEKTKRS